MFNMKRIITIAALALLPLSAGTLSLDQSLRLALSTHPDIKSALLKIAQSKEGERIEKSAWFPQLSVYGEYDFQHTYTTPSPLGFHIDNTRGWYAGVAVTQKIFDFSKTGYRVEASRIQRLISRLSAEEAKALMRYDVRNAYALALVQRAAIDVYRKDLASKKAMLEQARALLKQGLKTRADLSRFRSAMEQSMSDLAVAQAAYRKALITLETLIGRSIASGTRLQSSILYRNSHRYSRQNEEEVLRHNLSLAISRQQRQNAHALYKATERERFGSVDLVGDLSRVDALSRYTNKTLGLRYSAPIFQGGRLGAQTEKARLEELVSAEATLSRRRAVMREYRSLLADKKAMTQSIAAQKARIASAKETQKLMEARYRQGIATYIDVLDAQATLSAARLGLLNAYYQRRTIINRLEYLDGK